MFVLIYLDSISSLWKKALFRGNRALFGVVHLNIFGTISRWHYSGWHYSRYYCTKSSLFMICGILGDDHLQNVGFLRGLQTDLIFFNFSNIATYPRNLGNQNQKLAIFQKLLSENCHSVSPHQQALIFNVLKSCSECCGGIMLHLGRNIFVINYPYIVHAANVIQYNISLRVGCEKVPRIASVD